MDTEFNPLTGLPDIVLSDAEVQAIGDARYLKLDQTTPQTTVGRFTFPDLTIGTNTIYTTNGNVLIGTSTDDGVNKLQVNGNIRLTVDNNLLVFGTGSDASISYNGTNWLFNPKVVGSGYLNIQGQTLLDDKLMFTQTDGNEYIDSLADGYLDYGATTAHRFLANVKLTADNRKLIFGTGDDASIYYDGTNMLINPKEVGSGVVSVSGDVKANNLGTTIQTLSDGASISWNASSGGMASVTLGGNRALANPTNVVAGARYTLRVIQDGTGGRTLSYGANFKFPGGVTPVLSSGGNDVDLLEFVAYATDTLYFVNIVRDMQ